MAIISYGDTSNVTYDPFDLRYFDSESLTKELNRSFEICHGCRLCFKFCPSFPTLFDLIDNKHDGDVTKINHEEKEKIVGECFQCKLCYINCPYTKQDKHEYNLDFPALLQRAVHTWRQKSVSRKEKILQDADLAGKMNTGFISYVVNFSMRLKPFRILLQAILGIHKDKTMPLFQRQSFAKWFKKRKNTLVSDKKVVLFSTCFVNYNNPEVGKAVVEVLEKNSVEVEHPRQNCCGMPALNSGDLKFARKKMKANIDSLYPFAKEGKKILAINPTCSMTLKKEYTTFMAEGEYRDKAQVIADATMDVNEYLFTLKQNDEFNRDFQSTPKEISYHIPCHLRAQNIGYKSRDMMKTIPQAKIKVTAECSGHDGTWAMKKEYFEASLKVGKKAFEGLSHTDEACASTDCPLAAIHLQQGMNADERPEHPAQILAKAYKPPEAGGFKTKVEPIENQEGKP